MGVGSTNYGASRLAEHAATQLASREITALQRPSTQPSLVLVGLMGVGKSTVGKLLAQALEVSFHDTDGIVEHAAGMPVSEIFKRYGEAHFRGLERAAVTRLIDRDPKVIATGGGAFIDDAARELILSHATAVWLDADPAILAQRLAHDKQRPLLTDQDPEQVLMELAAKRKPLYAQAPLHVESGSRTAAETVHAIIDALATRGAIPCM